MGVKLTKAQKATLREMASYQVYYFRKSTCETLVALGYAEQVSPHLKRPHHRITPAGRAALSEGEAS